MLVDEAAEFNYLYLQLSPVQSAGFYPSPRRVGWGFNSTALGLEPPPTPRRESSTSTHGCPSLILVAYRMVGPEGRTKRRLKATGCSKMPTILWAIVYSWSHIIYVIA